MRVLAALIVCLASFVTALAAQGTGVYEDPTGAYRITVTLDDPKGPIGIEHFEAVSFLRKVPSSLNVNGGVAQDAIQFALTPETIAALPSRKAVKVRRSQSDETSEWLIDWSGIRAQVDVQLISSCTSGLAGQFTGVVTFDQSFVVTVNTAMSQLAVLSTMNKKGDADLYVYNSSLNLVCSSTLLTSTKISDQCGFLDSTCNQLATSYVEVYGAKNKNIFNVAVWFSNAI